MTPTPTPAPEVAEAAAAIDPTMLALLSIFGGAALTVGAGFLGAWIQSRREHEKWLREQRYEAFVRALVLIRDARSLARQLTHLLGRVAEGSPEGEARNRLVADLTDVKKRAIESRDRVNAAAAPISILGPSTVEQAMNAFVPSLASGDEAATQRAELTLVESMRTALSVKD